MDRAPISWTPYPTTTKRCYPAVTWRPSPSRPLPVRPQVIDAKTRVPPASSNNSSSEFVPASQVFLNFRWVKPRPDFVLIEDKKNQHKPQIIDTRWRP